MFANYGNLIKISIGIKDKIYTYELQPSAWALRLPDRKRLTFRDVNNAKLWGKLVVEEYESRDKK